MSTTQYDPQLPFLVELERRVRSYAEHAEVAVRPPTAPPPRRRHASTAPRTLRRTAILVALLCLIGATAYGTRAAFFTGTHPISLPRSQPITLARGHVGSDGWTLRVYARGGQVCGELTIPAQQTSSRCAPAPGAHSLEHSTVTSTDSGYVFGVSGTDVSTVVVRTAGKTFTVATHALGDRGARIGVSRSIRYFVAIVPRPAGPPIQSLTVTALDSHNRALGRPQGACFSQIGALTCTE